MGRSDRLGSLEELVLLALVRLGENAYGVTVWREIQTRAGKEISIGAIYTVLDRLERKGFVSSRIGEPTPERGGRAKRFFQIEAPGSRALNKKRDSVNSLAEVTKYA